MEQVARHLQEVVDRCAPLLRAIDARAAHHTPAPGTWSRIEILGHLLDSAGNNQQKFVRLLTATGSVQFVGYAQNAWVAAQHYQSADWHELIALWESFNRHLAHVIGRANPDAMANLITIDGKGPFRCDFVMRDYVEHLKHHLKAMLPDAGLTSAFQNVYGA